MALSQADHGLQQVFFRSHLQHCWLGPVSHNPSKLQDLDLATLGLTPVPLIPKDVVRISLPRKLMRCHADAQPNWQFLEIYYVSSWEEESSQRSIEVHICGNCLNTPLVNVTM